jgi:hypothetical protein
MRMVALALVLATAAGCAAPIPPTAAPTAAPTDAATAAPAVSSTPVANLPPQCSDAALIYDSSAQRMLLATCVDQLDPADHERIWSWDGAAWILVSDAGPSPLVVTAAAWDSARNVLVRYGGLPLDSNDCVPETWEWDGTEWTQRTTTDDPHPTACDHMKLAYDASRATTVLAGGGRLQDLSPETWGWDGRAWSRLADSGPAPRAHAGFGYDPANERVLMYGGINNTSIFADLWSWEGRAWRDTEFAFPGPRSHPGFALSGDSALLFGGATGQSTFGSLTDETALLSNHAWAFMGAPGPSPRGSPAVAYDPRREAWMLFGGFDATGAELADTWQFDGTAWECMAGCETGKTQSPS